MACDKNYSLVEKMLYYLWFCILQILQVPLSALSPPSVSLGAVGGHFNSTTKIKFVPLPAIFSPNPVRHRGVRSVRVHTDRYLPSSSGRQHHSHSTISESLLHLPSLDNRPRTRLIGQETARQKTREFKSQSGVLPHRVEQPFYMSGHRARIVGKEEKEEVSASVAMEEGRRVRFAKDHTLFYGRGLAHHPVASCGGREAVWRFEVRLNTTMERRRSRGPGEEDVEDSSKGFTAIVGENEKMSDDSKGHTFLTETRPRTNV